MFFYLDLLYIVIEKYTIRAEFSTLLLYRQNVQKGNNVQNGILLIYYLVYFDITNYS